MLIEKRKEFIINVMYFALMIAMVYLSIKYLLGLLLPFIIGFGVAVLLHPVTRIISKKMHIPRKISAVLFVVLFYTAWGFILSWLGIRLFSAIKELLLELPQIYSSMIEPALNTFFIRMEKLAEGLEPSAAQVIKDLAESLSGSAGAIVSDISSAAIQGISSAVSSVPSLFIAIAFAMISTLFFAIDYDRITEYIRVKSPSKVNKYIGEIKSFSVYIGSKYIRGYALLMLITFVELSIGLTVLGVDRPVLVAALIAIIDILPVIGTGGVVIPWIVIELISSNFSLAIGLIVVYVTITIVRNILEPKIIGEQLGLHPLIMLICMFIGAKVFGFAGMIALPVCVVVLKHLYDHGKFHFGEDNCNKT